MRERDLRAIFEQRDDTIANGLAERIVRDEIGAEHAREVEETVGDRTGVTVRVQHDSAKRLGERVLHLDAAPMLVAAARVANPSCDREREMLERCTGREPVAYGRKQALGKLLRAVHRDLPRLVRERGVAE